MMPELAADTRSEALKLYDEQQWFVIPTDPGAKKPYYGFTYKDRYGDTLPSREDVSYWPEWDKAGVRLGARTGAVSGIIVVDVDSQAAHEFIKTKGHPIGPMVQSPREEGGLHLYFRHPGFYVKSTVNLGGVDGLDIRGDNGIVILPPSPDHKTGREYQWIIPPEDVGVPECPEWLIDILKQQSEFKEPLDVPKTMAGVPEGQRDTELNRLAGKLRYMNMPQDVAIDIIERAAEKCNPPFGKALARSKVQWAFTHYAPGEDLLSLPALILSKDSKHQSEGRDKEGYLLPVSLGRIEKPGPREWLVEGLFPMKYPTTVYGSGGVSKSFLMLSLAMAIAGDEKQWMGFPITNGPVYYLDFELEVEEQARRAYEVAVGMGFDKPPEDLLYQSAAGMKMVEAFRTALHWCQKYAVKLLVVDSTGLALDGDAESSRDVIAFFREVVGSFVQIGTCVGLIDHQAKMQSGEKYQGKSAFGSGYKEYLSRSAIQVELMSRNDGEINVRFRQKKTNFGKLVDPFEACVTFGNQEVKVERVHLDDGELASEESLGAEERILRAVRHLESATPAEVAELTGLALGTARKYFSLLKKRESLMENGEVRDGAKVCVAGGGGGLLSLPSIRPVKIVNGKSDEKSPSAPVTYAPSVNPVNPENIENLEKGLDF